MIYRVANEKNIIVKVDERSLEEALQKDGRELPLEVINAMIEARDRRFLPRLREALGHAKQKYRIAAIYGVLSLLDRDSIPMLRAREAALSSDDMQGPLSERALLQAVLIRFEGSQAALAAFSDDCQPAPVKRFLPSNLFGSALPFEMGDVELLVTAMDAYVVRRADWIRSIPASDRMEDLADCTEALARAARETDLIGKLPSDKLKLLHDASLAVLKGRSEEVTRIDIAEFARCMPPDLARSMLKPLMGKARGEVKKVLQETLKILDSKR